MNDFCDIESGNFEADFQLTDLISCLESGSETLNETISSLSDLLHRSYTELKSTEENSSIPQSASYLLGMMSAAYNEIHNAKALIERVIEVTKALGDK